MVGWYHRLDGHEFVGVCFIVWYIGIPYIVRYRNLPIYFIASPKAIGTCEKQ